MAMRGDGWSWEGMVGLYFKLAGSDCISYLVSSYCALIMQEASRLQNSTRGALEECMHWTQQHLRALAVVRWSMGRIEDRG